MELTRTPILTLAAQIVSAHVGNNTISSDTIPNLIREVYRTLAEMGDGRGLAPSGVATPGGVAPGGLAPAGRTRMPTAAVEIDYEDDFDELADTDEDDRHAHSHAGHSHAGHAHSHRPAPAEQQTVFDDHLVCMDCGLSMKMLKRHLITVHGMTPEEYREKFGLPDDYPMVASSYAALRSSLAKQSGLGKRPEVKSKVPHHRAVAARGRK